MLVAVRAVAQPCVADCNRDGVVSVDELITGVNIVLGNSPPRDCPEMDVDKDGLVTVDNVLAGIQNVLHSWTTAKVDVGGYRLSIRCTGSGTPVVALDAGLGGTERDWAMVQPGIAMFTRVCSYTRAGYTRDGNGFSEAGPFPRTSGAIALDLHNLLANACLAEPYVLVGHSFGGQNVRLYASRYGDEVAGLVTVDGSHEDFFDEISARISPDLVAAMIQQQDDALMFSTESVRNEWAVREQRFAELRDSGPLPHVPMIILVGGERGTPPVPFENEGPALGEIWLELQQRLADSVPGSTLQVVPDAGHYIQNDRPDVVIDAIRTIVDEVHSASD